jgi:hypothetical protein
MKKMWSKSTMLIGYENSYRKSTPRPQASTPLKEGNEKNVRIRIFKTLCHCEVSFDGIIRGNLIYSKAHNLPSCATKPESDVPIHRPNNRTTIESDIGKCRQHIRKAKNT